MRQLEKAQLVGVYEVRETPEELRPFLNLEAKRENRQLRMSDKVVMLQVVGTASFVALFLDSIVSVAQLEERLRRQETEMTEVTKMTVERLLEDRKNA